MKRGKVYLVGAGPGDPKLLTLKGMEALQQSDTVVYDRLANPVLLRYMKPGAEKVYVGKRPDRHTMKQEEINQLLVDLALQGKTVTRLKGGDPPVFGRVGEEAGLLAHNGIEFEIVPGITSATAVPMYAGIPVTHREYNSSFTVLTGHEKPEKMDSMIDWEKTANASETLVFLMGVSKLRHICGQLMRYGRRPDTPIALVRWGTRAEQQTLTGTLADIAERVEQANFQPPAVIVVGEVVKLREQLAWFEKKPLFGKRVLVTRSRGQAGALAEHIEARGGEALEFPVIEIVRAESGSDLAKWNEVVTMLDDPQTRFDWIVFTSVNAVEHFLSRLIEDGKDIRCLAGVRIAAVGPKTEECLKKRGLKADCVPEDYRAEALAEALGGRIRPGESVLLPRGKLAGNDMPELLAGLGLRVETCVMYETRMSSDDPAEVVEWLNQGYIHAVTFTSSSTVTFLLEKIRQAGSDPVELLKNVKTACIGPVTARTATGAGLAVDAISEEATIESLVNALEKL